MWKFGPDGMEPMLFSAFVIMGLFVLGMAVTPVALVGIPSYLAYRLYRDSPARHERIAREQTQTLLRAVDAANVRLTDDEIEQALLAKSPATTPAALKAQLAEIGRRLFEAEGIAPDVPPPPPLHNTIEGARYRDMVSRAAQAGMDRNMALSALSIIAESLAVIARLAPPMDGDVMVPVTQFMDRPNLIVNDVIAPFFADNDYNHFARLKAHLDANLAATNRTNPVYPSAYKGTDAPEVYLAGTPLLDLFDLKTPFAIPEELRFEHTHIVAGSGHGKSQTLQYHIVKDLEDVARAEKTVIVIDSQRDLIRRLLEAKTVHADRIVLIDPEDIAFPVCLNLFSVGQERLASYDALERERLTNSIIELYDFVLGSLLAAGMTQKQNVIFRYVTRLMLHIPNATIHTLRDLLEPGGSDKYADAIKQLGGTARHFFENEFNTKEFEQTKRQVLRRLYGILENQVFERMFSHPKSKLDMFAEMNEGKLILINTAKSLLKEEGTKVLGRFFIALIAQAAQERATMPQWERKPVICYIDEAHEYFDENIGIILSQARKFKVGMVMAHQFLGQLEPKLQEAFEANTSIKLAGGVSQRDARALAGQFNCDAETIQHQPKGTFVTFVRGITRRAVPISFPFFVLENMPRASREEMEAIRAANRERYAEPAASFEAKVEAASKGGEDNQAPSGKDGEQHRKGQKAGRGKANKDGEPGDCDKQASKDGKPDKDDPTEPGDEW